MRAASCTPRGWRCAAAAERSLQFPLALGDGALPQHLEFVAAYPEVNTDRGINRENKSETNPFSRWVSPPALRPGPFWLSPSPLHKWGRSPGGVLGAGGVHRRWASERPALPPSVHQEKRLIFTQAGKWGHDGGLGSFPKGWEHFAEVSPLGCVTLSGLRLRREEPVSQRRRCRALGVRQPALPLGLGTSSVVPSPPPTTGPRAPTRTTPLMGRAPLAPRPGCLHPNLHPAPALCAPAPRGLEPPEVGAQQLGWGAAGPGDSVVCERCSASLSPARERGGRWATHPCSYSAAPRAGVYDLGAIALVVLPSHPVPTPGD